MTELAPRDLLVVRDHPGFVAAEAGRLEAMHEAQGASTDDERFLAAAIVNLLLARQTAELRSAITPAINDLADDPDVSAAKAWITTWAAAADDMQIQWAEFQEDLDRRMPPGRATELLARAASRVDEIVEVSHAGGAPQARGGELGFEPEPDAEPEAELHPQPGLRDPDGAVGETPAETLSETDESRAGLVRGSWTTLVDDRSSARVAVSLEEIAAVAIGDYAEDAVPTGRAITAATVAVRNVGTEWFLGDISLWARLLDSEYQEFECEPVDIGRPPLGDMWLAPGDDRRGVLTFLLPAGSHATECQISLGPGWTFGDWDLVADHVKMDPPTPEVPHAPAALGASVALEGFDGANCVVLTSDLIDPAQPGSEYDNAPAGSRLVAIRLVIENSGSVTFEETVDLDTRLVDQAGGVWESTISELAEPQLHSVRLAGGKKRAGYVGFVLPNDKTPRLAQFWIQGSEVAAEWKL